MKANILIAIAIGLLTYSLTIYFNHNTAPNIIVQDEQAAQQTPGTSSIAPDFTFTTTEGAQHALSDFKGKIIILNFWASWCAPCIKEFPDLLEIAGNYSDDVILIALSSDHDELAMNRFLDKLKKESVMLPQDNTLIALDKHNLITKDLYQTYRLPETIIIDRAGIQKHKLIGANWSMEDLHKILSAL